jgi:large subunit ribosomal protein L11
MAKKTLSLMVEGGKASPAPPVGPALAAAKMDIGKVVGDINAKTKDFAGIQVPVKIIYEPATKEYEIEVGTPPVSQMIKRELKSEKLAKTSWKEDGENADPVAGDLAFEKIVGIAKAKPELGHDLKKAVKQVLGTCVSCGVTIDGKKPREVQAEVDAGTYDEQLK